MGEGDVQVTRVVWVAPPHEERKGREERTEGYIFVRGVWGRSAKLFSERGVGLGGFFLGVGKDGTRTMAFAPLFTSRT